MRKQKKLNHYLKPVIFVIRAQHKYNSQLEQGTSVSGMHANMKTYWHTLQDTYELPTYYGVARYKE